jgi:two-component system, NtrC family, response regulator AtoC
VTLHAEALAALEAAAWPGNVRQLENFVERLVVLSEGPHIDPRDVSREFSRQINPFAAASVNTAAAEPTMDAQRRAAEREALTRALQGAAGNRSLAARILGISRRTLYKKLNEHKLAGSPRDT